MIQGLLPTRISSQSSAIDVEEAVQFYKDDLRNADIIDTSGSKNGCQFISRTDPNLSDTLKISLSECSLHF